MRLPRPRPALRIPHARSAARRGSARRLGGGGRCGVGAVLPLQGQGLAATARAHRRRAEGRAHLGAGRVPAGVQGHRGLLRARADLGQHPRVGAGLSAALLPGAVPDRPGRAQAAVRALRLTRARRAARHRLGHRARGPRARDPVRLPEVRARARGHGGGGEHFSAQERGARCGQGHGAVGAAGAAARGRAGSLGPRRSGPGAHRSRARDRRGDRRSAGAPDRRTGDPVDGRAASPLHPRGRVRDLGSAAGRRGSAGARAHGGPHDHPVGQVRPGDAGRGVRHQPDQAGSAGAGDADADRARIPAS